MSNTDSNPADNPQLEETINPADIRVMVVDDAKTMRTILVANLEAAGFDVIAAENGQQALDLFKKDGADLIILDLVMKDMDGLQVLWHLRENHDRMELPVIVATGSSEEEDVVSAFEQGANDYIRKPIKFPILFARMEAQLQLKFAFAELRASKG